VKLISWNTNGLRAAIKNGFKEFFSKIDADIFCIQETKMQEEQLEESFDGYYRYMSSAIKKGYSGTLVLSKIKPISVVYGIDDKYNDEGRVITLEYNDFYLVNVYSPNSKDGLLRIDYRMVYEDDLRNYLLRLSKLKHVVLCGDLKVAQKDIDLKNPSINHKNPGFSDEERGKFNELLNAGFIDTFRYLYPDKVKYSWWSYRMFARSKGVGWRIDYFVVSVDAKSKIISADILDNVFGSDHCPVMLEFDVN
jgi:exodeoxyribonuclease-3